MTVREGTGDHSVPSREAALLSHYERHAHHYRSPLDRLSVIEVMRALGVSGMSILDVGCGDGRLVDQLPPDWVVDGIDYSPTRIRLARERRRYRRLVCGSVYDLADHFPDRYDVAVAVELLEHTERPADVIDQIRRVAASLLATVPIDMPYRAHLQVYPSAGAAAEALGAHRFRRFGRHVALAWSW
ncbi:MAG: class I SAM-dependent methyltransferase [Actinomycetota bacterium]